MVPILQKRNRPVLQVAMIVLVLVFSSVKTNAQQSPMYAQYMFNMMNINPAYAGSRGTTTFTGLSRNQWVGIRNAPKTTTLSMDMPVNNERIGLGFQLYDDKLGVERTTGFNFSYAFRIRMSDAGTLSLGLQGGVLNYRANYTTLNTRQAGDPVFAQDLSGILPAAAAGVFYNSDNFYAGISTPALLKTKIRYDAQADVTYAGQDLQLYTTAGFVARLNDNVVLKPSTLIKIASGAPVQFDLNLNAWFHDIISVGASYRTGDAYVGMAELQLTKQFRMGYAYEHPMTDLRSYSSGTHELMLRFELGGGNQSKAVSPRYF
ncbi:MAG: type IX secretion system membrane protein PorP/SprF [Bacteroidota bacterium]